MSLNKAALDKLRSLAGSEEDFAELVSSFCEEAPQLLKALAASFAAGDYVTARRSAHSLKSNARDFGAHELADACARIERSIGEGNLPDPAEVAAIPGLFDHVAQDFRIYCSHSIRPPD